MAFSCGHIAQLVERLNGIQEVRGSSPLMSTALEEGIVAQLVRALPCQGRGRGFESRRFRMRVSPLGIASGLAFFSTPQTPHHEQHV